MYKKLRLRLTAVCTFVTGLILALLTAGTLSLAEAQIKWRAYDVFEQAAVSALNSLTGSGQIDYGWLSRTEANTNIMIDVTAANGTQLLYHNLLKGGKERKEYFRLAYAAARERYGFDITSPQNTASVFFEFQTAAGEWFYAQAASFPSEDGYVGYCALKSQAQDHARITSLRLRFGVLVVIATLFLFIFSYLFSAYTLSPIEENQKKQAAFVSAASHELRSPLAVIQSGLEAIDKAPEQAPHFLPPLHAECGRLNRLVSDMLTLARADNHTWNIRREKIGLEYILLTAAESYETIAAKKNIVISVNLPENVLLPCLCDPQRITQVLSILLDNAVYYLSEGSCIRITGRRKRGGVEFRVIDNGPGIPDSIKPHVFDRFFRADESRGQDGHQGLGLSIAAEIMALHHGAIHLEDSPGGGCTFVAWLPNGG